MVLYGYVVNVVHGTMIKRETTLSEFPVYCLMPVFVSCATSHFVCIMVCDCFVFLMYECANVSVCACMCMCVPSVIFCVHKTSSKVR